MSQFVLSEKRSLTKTSFPAFQVGFFYTVMSLQSYLCFILTSMFIALWKSNVLSDTVVPVGHLKPLGSHRPPQTNLVDDLEEMPSPQDFWRKYVLPSRAVVLRGAAKHAKAFTEWTDKYIKEKYADLEIRLEGKKEKSSKVPVGAKGVGRDTIGTLNMLLLFWFSQVRSQLTHRLHTCKLVIQAFFLV